ncbi:MAG: hypothetical protein WAR79_04380 [Melioribacteraceae bacterium]
MKELNFQPAKTKEDFRENYKLHDLAEYHGKNLLAQWGITFEEFGKDNRYKKVWEKGEDKPDIIAEYNNLKFLIEWKSKTANFYLVNKRAVNSYKNWAVNLKLEAVICFFIFDKNNFLVDRRFALLSKHKFEIITEKAWDKNDVVKFNDDLPILNKFNLINYLNNNNQ